MDRGDKDRVGGRVAMTRGGGEDSGRPGTLDRGLSIIDRLALEDRPLTEDEVNPGTAGVSVPVRLGRDIVGSLTLAAPGPRFTPHSVDRMTTSLAKVAALSTRRLAGQAER